MTLGLAFWILMLIWLFGIGVHVFTKDWASAANGMLLYMLFVLLGWAVFGAPIKG